MGSRKGFQLLLGRGPRESGKSAHMNT